MVEYWLKNIYFCNYTKCLPDDVINLISEYLPSYKFKYDIKKKNYLQNNLWYKRLICRNIVNLRRDEINYFDWYKIFHYKDYSILIKYENKKVKKLLETLTIEEINKLHMENLDNAHKKHYLSYSYKTAK
jgi:hypothetical protein